MKVAWIFGLLVLVVTPLTVLGQTDSLSQETDEEVVYDSIDYDTAAYESYSESEETAVTMYQPSQLKSTERYKQEELTVHPLDKEKWKKVVGDKNYDEKPPVTPKATRSPNIPPMTWKILSILLVVVLLGFVIYFLLRNIKFGTQVVRNVAATSISGPVEDLATIDLAQLLQQALEDRDYRRAIRIHFLQLLKDLDIVRLIRWTKDKTNRDYLNELAPHQDIYPLVRSLTLTYEFVWYGERSVTADSYQKIAISFHEAAGKVQSSQTAAA